MHDFDEFEEPDLLSGDQKVGVAPIDSERQKLKLTGNEDEMDFSA